MGINTNVLMIPEVGGLKFHDGSTQNLAYVDSAEPKFILNNVSFTCTPNRRYAIDTRSGVVTANLPTNPSIGDTVFFLDAFGSFANFNLIIEGNGKTILGATNLSVSVNNDSIGVMYNGEEWRLYE